VANFAFNYTLYPSLFIIGYLFLYYFSKHIIQKESYMSNKSKTKSKSKKTTLGDSGALALFQEIADQDDPEIASMGTNKKLFIY